MDERMQDNKAKILARIEEFERNGQFDKDIEDDPPFTPLDPEKIDFLNSRFKNKVKRIVANVGGRRFYEKLIKSEQVVFSGVAGLENLKDFQGGAIVTCNHCHIFDNYAVLLGLKKQFKRLRLYKVIREGNYAMPGKIGFFMRHCDTLPVSQNISAMTKLMRAVQTLLKRKKLVLVFPEQGMWQNYRKPRPMKAGAFKFAAKFSAPVIPCFITFKDSGTVGADGFENQEFTLNVLPVIYPDSTLSERENCEIMKEKNFAAWKETYERVYGMPLEYLQPCNIAANE